MTQGLYVRLIDGRPMQCKDIPDEVFLQAVRRTRSTRGDTDPGGWRMRWDVHATLEAEMGPIPVKLLLAKASRLMDRGLLGGCPCGCRGDYHLPEGCYPTCCRRRREAVSG
jgi:hypothetical protein